MIFIKCLCSRHYAVYMAVAKIIIWTSKSLKVPTNLITNLKKNNTIKEHCSLPTSGPAIPLTPNISELAPRSTSCLHIILKRANLRENIKTETKGVQRQAEFSHTCVANHLPTSLYLLDGLFLSCNSACQHILGWEGKWCSPDTSVQGAKVWWPWMWARLFNHRHSKKDDSHSSWTEVQRSDLPAVSGGKIWI